MNEITVALLGFAGTLLGSLFGVLAAQKLTQYRLAQLEEKVERHNNFIERTFRLEGQMSECQHDIKTLKAYHLPNKLTTVNCPLSIKIPEGLHERISEKFSESY